MKPAVQRSTFNDGDASPMSTSQIEGNTLDSNRRIEIFSIFYVSKRAKEDFAYFDTGGKCQVISWVKWRM